MANGLAKGYTQVGNEIMEDVTREDFTKREYKMILWTIRNGYGFKREQSECDLNVTQIAADTGLDRSHVWKTIHLLNSKNVLMLGEGKVRFNRHADQWIMAKTATNEVWPKQPQTMAKTATNKVRPKQPQHMAKLATNCGQNSLEHSGNTLNDSGLPSPKERKKEKRNPHTPTNGGLSLDESFNQIWKIYPKKVSKAVAKKAFQKIKPNKELFDTMKKAIELHSRSRDWTKENGKYIPHLSTWLNQERWEDEIETTAQTGFGLGDNYIEQKGFGL